MTSIPRVGADPLNTDADVNRARENRRYRFLPNRFESHPVIGMMIALETR